MEKIIKINFRAFLNVPGKQDEVEWNKGIINKINEKVKCNK